MNPEKCSMAHLSVKISQNYEAISYTKPDRSEKRHDFYTVGQKMVEKKVYESRKMFDGTFVSEDLTKLRSNLLYQARQERKKA